MKKRYKEYEPVGFPRNCPECGSVLVLNKDWDYLDEWWASYTCTNSKCSIKVRYMPSDMGQTRPQYQQYISRRDQEKRDKKKRKEYEKQWKTS